MKQWIIALCMMLLGGSTHGAENRPNILWLTSEDNNVTWLGCYGNELATTPNIDRLAKQGFQYMHCYANAPVCSPSRATWITGLHAISMGTHPMRSRYKIPHDRIPYYPDLLKKAGYYTANAGKTDYNIGGRSDQACWDKNSGSDWKQLKNQQPFFQVLNIHHSHESRAFGDVGKTKHDPHSVQLAAYHPDIPVMRQNYAHYLDAVERMDGNVGHILKQLEDSGLADNTIVIYNSDHGGVIARSKRFLYDSGTHCPLIVRIPEKYKAWWPAEKPGTKIDRLVSFIDMPKTWLNLVGASGFDHMQGVVFLGPGATKEREYHFAWRARMDERCDNVRAIRDKKFLYIKNYMPYAPWGQRLTYLWRMEATRAWAQHHRDGKTDKITGRFFGTKPFEELYDTTKDPDNVNNLADDPEYAAVMKQMRNSLRECQQRFFDSALLPESEVARMAKQRDVTIYDLVRNKDWYDVAAYQTAADVALVQDPEKINELVEYLEHEDVGIRYWGIVGLFLQAEKARNHADVISKALQDESDHVKLMAAWALHKQGDKESAYRAINELIRAESYAMLKVLNVIDWIGEGTGPYQAAFENYKSSARNYEQRMVKYLSAEN